MALMAECQHHRITVVIFAIALIDVTFRPSSSRPLLSPLCPVSHSDPTTGAHRLITGSQNTVHYVAVFIGLARTRSVTNAFNEMTHFRLIAICKRFLGQWPGPAKIYFSFLYYVARGS